MNMIKLLTMTKSLLLSIALSCCFLINAHSQQAPAALTLQQAIDIAISNNLDAKQSELLMQQSRVIKQQARFDLFPDVNGNISHGINEGRSIDPFTNNYINQKINFGNYNLGSSLLLFNGLQLHHTMKQKAYAFEASRMEWQQTKDNITLNVILAYLQLLSAEEQLTASQQQVQVSRKQVERLKILNEQGAIQPALLYDLQGQLANDELSVIEQQNAISLSKLLLSQLMNVPFNKELKAAPISAEAFLHDETLTVDRIYEEASRQLAVIKAVELRKAAASVGLKAAKGGFFPSIGLNANIFTNYSSAASREVLVNTFEKPSGDYVDVGGSKFSVIRQQSVYNSEKISYINQFNNNYSSSLSVGIRVPILNGFRTKNLVALAKLDLKNAEYLEQNTRIQLKQQIEQAYFNMSAAYNKYNILNTQVKSFTESFRIAEVRFNAGASTQVDYLIAKNNLDRANINLITARYDYLLRKKILDFYQGKLNIQ
jgi:outer membrane protein